MAKKKKPAPREWTAVTVHKDVADALAKYRDKLQEENPLGKVSLSIALDHALKLAQDRET